MKIHGITVVKNEADIIGTTLRSALAWIDVVYIFDNGSTDGTWEIIKDLARDNSNIVIAGQDEKPFDNSIRHNIYDTFRHHSGAGDWWMKLDSDEIYIDNPRIFLRKIPDYYQSVWSASFQYFFTDRDLERYKHDQSLYSAEVPIEQRLRYYINDWSEPRFAREIPQGAWRQGHPAHRGRSVYPVRIWLKHYQWRSPEQMQRRLESRFPIAHGKKAFRHVATSVNKHGGELNWRNEVRSASDLYLDEGDARYVPRYDLMPELPFPRAVDVVPPVLARAARMWRRRLSKKIAGR